MAGVSINPVMQEKTQAPSEITQVVAQPRDNFVSPAASDASKLFASLQEFLPQAGAVADKLDHNNQFDARTAGQTAALQEADPYTAMAKADTLRQPDSVAPFYSKFFTQGFRQTIGQSMSSKSRDSFFADYDASKNKEGFSPDQFVADWKTKEFAGITDSEVLTSLNKEFVASETAMRTDYRAKMHTDLVDASKQHTQESISGLLTADQSPLQLHDKLITDILPAVTAQGVLTKPEAIKYAIDHVANMSQALGGRPNMFDAFYATDPEGHTLADVDPVLANAVADAKHKAQLQQDTVITDDMLRINSNRLAGLHDAVGAGRWDLVSQRPAPTAS